MKCNPWLDHVLPQNADADRIRYVVRTVLPVSPKDQQAYIASVILAMPNCPAELKQQLQEITHG